MTLRRLSFFMLAFMLAITFGGDSRALLSASAAENSFSAVSSDVVSSDMASPDLRNESNSTTRRKRRRYARYKEESPPPSPRMSVQKSRRMSVQDNGSMIHQRRQRYDNFSDRRQKNSEESLFASSARDNNMAEIESIAETALAHDPEDYLTAYRTSKAAYDIADYEKAMKWVKKALSISPRYVPALSLRQKITGAMNKK